MLTMILSINDALSVPHPCDQCCPLRPSNKRDWSPDGIFCSTRFSLLGSPFSFPFVFLSPMNTYSNHCITIDLVLHSAILPTRSIPQPPATSPRSRARIPPPAHKWLAAQKSKLELSSASCIRVSILTLPSPPLPSSFTAGNQGSSGADWTAGRAVAYD